MIKFTTFASIENDIPLIRILNNELLEKTAGYRPEVEDYISKIDRKNDKTYILINAMTAGDFYGCFPEGTKVRTREGYKNIEDVVIGDQVLTHKKRFKPVLETSIREFSGSMVRIDLDARLSEIATEGHPFWVLRLEQCDSILVEYYKQRIDREEFLKQLSQLVPEFVLAKDIRPGDYVYMPLLEEVLNAEQFSIDEAYIFGYYLAEGCIKREYRKGNTYKEPRGLVYTFGPSDTEMIAKLSSIIHLYTKAMAGNVLRCEYANNRHAEEAIKLFGAHATKKFIAPEIFTQSREWILTFLAAYFDGDGMIMKDAGKYTNTLKASTASRELAMDLQRLLASVDITSSISHCTNRVSNGCLGTEDHNIYQISVGSNCSEILLKHSIRLKEDLGKITNAVKGTSLKILPTGYGLVPVKNIAIYKDSNITEVYNLEVEEDNSYTTGIIGHNCNLNGDFFVEDQLKKYHKTFEEYAYNYMHHVNKQPEKSLGKVIFATYNPEMHRVELISELDNEKAKDIIERINKNDSVAVSMGTRTPSDKCSVCGNRAKNTAAYCDHLKYQMRHLMPDGRRVYAINDDKLTFFDISFVRVPADRTASVITKVAHVHDEDEKPTISSALIGEAWLKNAGIKEADLFKEVPGTIEGMSPDPKGLILTSTKRPTEKDLDKMAEFPLKEVLSTLLGLQMPLLPHEFSHVVMKSMGRQSCLSTSRKYIDLGEDPVIPVDVTMSGFNAGLAEQVGHLVPGVSLTKPLIIHRVLIKRAELAEQEEMSKQAWGAQVPTDLYDPIKNFKQPEIEPLKNFQGPTPSPYSPVKNPIVPLAGLGGLYWGWTRLFGNANAKGIDKILMEHPKLLPIFVGMVSLGTVAAQKMMFNKEAGFKNSFWPRVAVAVPASYLGAGYLENKVQKGEQINSLQDIVRKHPFLVGMGATIGAGAIGKKFVKMASLDRVIYGLEPEQFDKFYNDVIGNS